MSNEANRIKEAREAAGLTQGQLADLIGGERVSVSKWETGKSNPSGYVLDSIGYRTGFNPDWMRSGHGQKRLEGVAEQSIPYRADALDEVRMREVIELTEEYLAPLNPDERPAPAQIAGLIMKFYAIEVEMNLPPQGMRDRILPFLKSLRAG
jgi:transcriptional regulator with XRE-family HTH domain